jgi:SPP1 gp7 family putative phage head morphogenesis protein
MKYLKPVINRPQNWEEVEKEILRVFLELLYKPLMEVLQSSGVVVKELKNAKPKRALSPHGIVKAIESGRIVLTKEGYLEGKLSASVSKELKKLGAVWDKRKRAFKFKISEIPAEVLIAQSAAQSKAQKVRDNVRKYLDGLENLISGVGGSSPNSNEGIEDEEFARTFKHVIGLTEKEFQESIKAVSIEPSLSQEMKDDIAKDYAENLGLYIKKWTRESILRLRQKVQAHAFGGGRAESLAEVIRSDYGVSKSKAKFLARQETSLLVSKFRETRFKDAGVERYIWRTSKDARVRESHKALDGKDFRWDDPPFVDGEAQNPGEPYGCRCIAIPVIE